MGNVGKEGEIKYDNGKKPVRLKKLTKGNITMQEKFENLKKDR